MYCIKTNIFRLLQIALLFGVFSLGFASYDSQVKEINQLIKKNMQTMKSKENLDIPEYKGDTLTFERLSKIRNVFDEDHALPFEKKKVIAGTKAKPKVVKLKPIVVPPELRKIMNIKKTKLQEYPINSFIFKGVVYQKKAKWGIVENPSEQDPIYLKKGQLIGQDYGQVENITNEGILVDEWKKNTEKRVWEKIRIVIH